MYENLTNVINRCKRKNVIFELNENERTYLAICRGQQIGQDGRAVAVFRGSIIKRQAHRARVNVKYKTRQQCVKPFPPRGRRSGSERRKYR